MPRASGDGGAALISIPGCLICWEPLQQRKTSTTSINSEKTFRRICSILNVDLSSSTWDFRIEAFPFCGTCTREIQQLIRLQDKLELIQKEIQDEIQTVRNKLVGSDRKFISTDLRIIGFRSQVLGGQSFTPQQQQEQQISVNQLHSSPSTSSGIHSLSLNYHPVHEQVYANATTTTVDYASTPNFLLGLVNPNAPGNITNFVQFQQHHPSSSTVHQNYHPVVYNRIEDRNSGFDNSRTGVDLVELEVEYDESNSNEYNDSGPTSVHDDDEEDYVLPSESTGSFQKNKRTISNLNKPRTRYQKPAERRFQTQPTERKAEEFAPVNTSGDGRMFYENVEIMKNNRGTFYCGQCEYNKVRANSSVTLTRMKIHINGVHLDRYKCSICDKSYTSREHLILHEKKQHKLGVPLTPCPICGMPITDFSNWMKVHMWKHKNAEEKAEARAMGLEPREITCYRKPREKKHKCPHCSSSYTTRVKMERHAAKHLDPKMAIRKELASPNFKTVFENIEITRNETGFVCGKCGHDKIKGFRIMDLEQMKIHIKAAHFDAFMCDICDRKCKDEKTLNLHKLKLHQDREAERVPCEICQKPILPTGKKIHLWSHMNAEEKAEAGAKSYQKVYPQNKKHVCSTCGKGFDRPNRLREHMKSHLPRDLRKNLKCNHCSRMFRTTQSLLSHVKTIHEPHTVVRWFTCEACGKKFLFKRLHDMHFATHKDKPKDKYFCKICPRKFGRRSHLKLHMKTHRRMKKCILKGKPIDCEICGKEKLDYKEYRLHSWSHYGPKEMATLLNSGEAMPPGFEEQEDLSWLAHQENENKCGDCLKPFTTPVALNDHRIKCHKDLLIPYQHYKIDKDSKASTAENLESVRKSSRLTAKFNQKSKRKYVDWESSDSESDSDDEDDEDKIPIKRKTPQRSSNTSVRRKIIKTSAESPSLKEQKSSGRLSAKKPRPKIKYEEKTSSSESDSSDSDSSVDYSVDDEHEKYEKEVFKRDTRKNNSSLPEIEDNATISLTTLPKSILDAQSIKIISDEMVTTVNPNGSIKMISLVPDNFYADILQPQSDENNASDFEIEYKVFPECLIVDPDPMDDTNEYN